MMTGTSVVDALNIPESYQYFRFTHYLPIVGLVFAGGLICCAATGAVLRNGPYPPDASRT
ncbi:hypothetical protein KCP78_17845 [Salmonella enterica subsp. enterica]|nr:hypothetical protein KCP78_17845 [Salmonella enterica subsp. enterica]